MENKAQTPEKATPEKKELSLKADFSSFKPSLNAVAKSFVPTSAPKVDFSPQKEENPNKTENLSVLKFDLNAPVFTPSFVSAPAPKKK